MNILSIGASYGVLTAIFQFGWLSGLIGLPGPVPIVSYVPLFMFAILFGLSMDYEVFLVSQIEEHVHAGEDNKTSVVRGLVTSARVITAAALIMVFVFGSFVLNGDPTVKQFGIGLAVAVILDATVVRCLLVPALMILMGKVNWYMPRWLDRLVPRLSIEGAEFFERATGRSARTRTTASRIKLARRERPSRGAATGRGHTLPMRLPGSSRSSLPRSGGPLNLRATTGGPKAGHAHVEQSETERSGFARRITRSNEPVNRPNEIAALSPVYISPCHGRPRSPI